jgi:hypothetical protein
LGDPMTGLEQGKRVFLDFRAPQECTRWDRIEQQLQGTGYFRTEQDFGGVSSQVFPINVIRDCHLVAFKFLAERAFDCLSLACGRFFCTHSIR